MSDQGIYQENDAAGASTIGTIDVEKFVLDYKVGDQTDPISLLLKTPLYIPAPELT
jgi:hypothetical protein